MRVQKKISKKAIIVTIVVVFLLAGIGVGTYALLSQDNQPENKTTSKGLPKASRQSTDSGKSNSTDNGTDTAGHESTKEIQPPYEGENVNNSQSLTGVINYKSVVDGSLVIRTTINQMLGSGTCSLTLTSGQKTVTRTSNITQNPSSSTCEGFNIPTSELGSGDWKIEIQVVSDGRAGTLNDNVNL